MPPHVVALGFAAGGALFAYQAPALTPRNGAARWGLVLALAVALVAVAGVTVARRHAAGRFPAANAWVRARPVGDIAYDGFHVSVSRANEVEVRRVEGGRVLVQQVARSSWRYLPSAFDAHSGQRVRFELDDVKATVAAPPGWIRGGFLGLAFALGCALAGLLRRRTPRDGWSPAMHHGGGVLRTYEREGRFDGAAGLALGPVFVRSPTEAGNAYRDGPSTPITHVIRAVGIDLDRSLAALDLAPFVLALGALFALAAPLLVASLYGLA